MTDPKASRRERLRDWNRRGRPGNLWAIAAGRGWISAVVGTIGVIAAMVTLFSVVSVVPMWLDAEDNERVVATGGGFVGCLGRNAAVYDASIVSTYAHDVCDRAVDADKERRESLTVAAISGGLVAFVAFALLFDKPIRSSSS